MITIILAGGYATRLYPITKGIAKPLLRVGGKPIIDYIMDKLVKLKDISQIIIATNKKFEDQFISWLAQSNYKKVKIKVEDSFKEEDKPGAIKALYYLISELKDEDCIVIAGDNLFTSSLDGFIRFYESKKSPVVAVYNIEDLRLAKSFSTVKIDEEGRIVDFKEKPEEPETSLIGTCIYAFPNKSFRRIEEYLKEGNDQDNPGSFIQWLFRKEPIYGYVLQGLWFDVGTPKSYEEARRAFKALRNK